MRVKRSIRPRGHEIRLAAPTLIRNIMNAALDRANDGQDRASAVEPFFGNLIDSLDMKALTKLPAKTPAGATGVESGNQLF